MIDNLFLDYANYSLQEDPENLNKIFEDIFYCGEEEFGLGKEYAKTIVKSVICDARLNDPHVYSAEFGHPTKVYDPC